jgi:hypothetical protein
MWTEITRPQHLDKGCAMHVKSPTVQLAGTLCQPVLHCLHIALR